MTQALYHKLRRSNITLVSGTVLILMASAAYLSFHNNQLSLAKAQAAIHLQLHERGRALVTNQGLALSGLVADFAFIDIAELVKRTVEDDPSIIYGAFVDIHGNEWAAKISEGATKANWQFDSGAAWVSVTEPVFQKRVLNGVALMEFAAPVSFGEDILGYITYALTMDHSYELQTLARARNRSQLMLSLLVLGSVGLISIVIAFVLSRRSARYISSPIAALTEVAHRIVDGRFDTNIQVNGQDEVAVLARAFESMQRAIESRIADLTDLNTLSTQMSSQKTIEGAVESAINGLSAMLPAKDIAVYLSCDGNVWTLVCRRGLAHHPEPTLAAMVATANEGVSLRTALTLVKQIATQCEQGVSAAFVFVAEEQQLSHRGSVISQALLGMLLNALQSIYLRELIESHNAELEARVAARSKALVRKSNDITHMLHHMNQGLLVIDESLRVDPEYAVYLETILGTNTVAGELFTDVLFADSDLSEEALARVQSAVCAILGQEEFLYRCNSGHLPERYHIFVGAEKKTLLLQWNPIVAQGVVEKLMVSVIDVTQVSELQVQAEQQAQELTIIGQILAVPEPHLALFITDAKELLAKKTRLFYRLKRFEMTKQEMITGVLAVWHTLKGNARLYQFSYLAQMIHELESQLMAAPPSSGLSELERLISNDQLLDEIQRYASLAQHTLHRDLGEKTKPCAGAQVALLDALAPLAQGLPMLAKKMQRPIPRFRIRGGQLKIPGHWASAFRGICLHIISNALCHGFHSRSDKIRALKGGVISLWACATTNGLHIQMSDDGVGVSKEDIYAQQVESGSRQNQRRFAECNFDDDDSVKRYLMTLGQSRLQDPSLEAGQGIGLLAAHHLADDIGATLEVELRRHSSGRDYCSLVFHLFLSSQQLQEVG